MAPLVRENNIGDFQLAYPYAALNLVLAPAGEADEIRRQTERVLSTAGGIPGESDRELLIVDLETISGLRRFWWLASIRCTPGAVRRSV